MTKASILDQTELSDTGRGMILFTRNSYHVPFRAQQALTGKYENSFFSDKVVQVWSEYRHDVIELCSIKEQDPGIQ